jgi:hypothetical protein
MKVAAVARMCQSTEVWRSMFQSGTPCPILSNGKLVVGKRAFLVMKTQPELYIPDYKKNQDYYQAILKMGETDEEDNSDIISISAKFRSSIK